MGPRTPRNVPRMTPEEAHIVERVGQTERRVERLETDIYTEIKSINDKLTSLAIAAAARRDCPSPGLCVTLKERIDADERDKRVLTANVVQIQKWQAGIIMCLMLIGVIITFFGPAIRHFLGIQQ